MGKSLAIVALLFTFLAAPLTTVQARQDSETRYKQKQKKNLSLSKRAELIEIIEGIPSRPFKKIGPIWDSGHSEWGLRPNMQKTMKRLKKSAAKMGADAIIEFRIGTGQSSVGSGYGFGHGSGGTATAAAGWGSISNPSPVIQGWAVKWVRAEERLSPGAEIGGAIGADVGGEQ